MLDKLRTAKSVIVTTGSGISAESGIPTFRGADGLWKKYQAEELATPNAFNANPELVWEWYDWRRQLIGKAEPNPGHEIIAKMEKHYQEFLLITQNVDGLHRKAGSNNMVEIHGNIWRVRCTSEGTITYLEENPIGKLPPICECGALLRPDVVWFGEMPYRMEEIIALTDDCDLFVAIGTSGAVYPAAGFVADARDRGARTLEINLEPSENASLFDESLLGQARHR